MTYRIDGYTTVSWSRASEGRCRRCSRPAEYLRVTTKRTQTGKSIELACYCERHTPLDKRTQTKAVVEEE